MPGLLELLLGGGNPQLRLGGEDTPAGGGVLDMLGQRIMQQQLNPQMGGAAPLNAQAAPQQATAAPQSAQVAPQASMPQQGGGLLGRLFGGARGPSNSTVQYLMNKGYDASAAQAIASDPDTLRRVVATVGGPQERKQSSAEDRIALAKQYNLSPEEERAYALTGQLPTERGGEAELGLNIVYGTDEQGNDIAFQPSKAGGLIPVKLPPGFKLSPGVQKVDLGTQWGFADRNGNIVSTQPKNIEEAAQQAAAGKAKGEDTASYESLSSKMPGLEKVVNDLDKLSQEATYTTAGVAYDSIARQMGMEPREAAVARAKYKAMVDNQVLPLLRDTFGAQFTVAEGESLRATLGNPDLSPPEKQEVLKAFIEQKRRDVEALGTRTGRVVPGSERMGTAGEWTDAGNGIRIRRKQ